MGSIANANALFDSREWKNGMRPDYAHFRAIDAAQDRLATGGRRMAIPLSMGRGQDNSYWSAGTDWKHTITVPAYTAGIGIGVLGKIRKSSNTALNVIVSWGPDGADWDHYVTLTQAAQGLPSSVYADNVIAHELPWVWTNDSLVVAQPNSPMAVTASNEAQTIPIYMKSTSTLTYQILSVMVYAIPYQGTTWPSL